MRVMFAGLPRPLLFGHRGASRLAPENTLEAFELAYRMGAHVLELDVHLSADGEVVVLHDSTLQRTTDGHGEVRHQRYRDLARLDAGCKFVTPGGARPFVGRGVVLPRLEDVMSSFPACGFNIEVKQAVPSMVVPVLQVLERVGNPNVLLAASRHDIMQTLEGAGSDCPLGLSSKQVLRAIIGAYGRGMPALWSGRALQIPPFHRGLPLATSCVLRAARRAGVEVHLWTVNHPGTAKRYLQRGVDGIMSDDPGTLGHLFPAPRRRS